jgi:hypothetical protein
MDNAPLYPWDQLPGEPDEAYARFLIYRNLGLTRSVAKARVSRKGKKGEGSSGCWSSDSATYAWVKRAVAWDIDNLKAHGPRLAVVWAECVMAIAEKTLSYLRDAKSKPKSFDSVVNAVEKLAKYVSADALDGIQSPVEPVPVRTEPPALQLTRSEVA